MTKPPIFDEIEVGDRLPELVHPPIARDRLAAFAAASGDSNPIHLDDPAARAAGLPGVIAHGMFNMAALGRLITDWAPQAAIVDFHVRFTAMARPGDVITCAGEVKAKTSDANGPLVEIDISARKQDGSKVLSGGATLRLQ